MTDFKGLRPAVKIYVSSVVLTGTALVAHSVYRLYQEPMGSQWFILAGLTLLTGSFTVKIPATSAHLSVSETFVLASVILFGPAAGTMTVLLECLVILFWLKESRGSLHKVLFNTSALAASIWISGTLFFVLARVQPYSKHVGDASPSAELQTLFLPLLAFTVVYFLLNTWLIAIAMGLESGKKPFDIWWNNFIWLSVNYFSGASVAALIVTYSREISTSTLAIIVPLLVVSYL